MPHSRGLGRSDSVALALRLKPFRNGKHSPSARVAWLSLIPDRCSHTNRPSYFHRLLLRLVAAACGSVVYYTVVMNPATFPTSSDCHQLFRSRPCFWLIFLQTRNKFVTLIPGATAISMRCASVRIWDPIRSYNVLTHALQGVSAVAASRHASHHDDGDHRVVGILAEWFRPPLRYPRDCVQPPPCGAGLVASNKRRAFHLR